MTDKLPDPQEIIAAHTAEMDKLFSELGLPVFGEHMDEAAALKAYEESLPPAVRAARIEQVEARHAALRKMVSTGADLEAQNAFDTDALGTLFHKCDTIGMLILLEAGADGSGFEFAPAHLAVLRGDWEGANVPAARDARGRSPFLLACRLGQVTLVTSFFAADPDTCLRDRSSDGDDALMLAMWSGNRETIDFLLAQGFGADEPDECGATPIYHAVELGNMMVAKALLDRGASLDVRFNLTASLKRNQNWLMSKVAALSEKMMPAEREDSYSTLYDVAHGPDMVKLLISYGANPASFPSETFVSAIGADQLPERAVTYDDFIATYAPLRGTKNPEQVDLAFWYEQIRTNRSGYGAKVEFLGEGRDADGPVWSFDRFGRSGTVLPDGRLVLIAGEHEDGYMPDFYIYNDVTVMHPHGDLDHYIYPLDVFPPTDFHTATLVDDAIWIIGALGYPGQRQHGQTQVLRLELSDFSIHRVQTDGMNPGWINRHRAELNGRHIVVTGGKVEPGYADLEGVYVLDLDTLAWQRAS